MIGNFATKLISHLDGGGGSVPPFLSLYIYGCKVRQTNRQTVIDRSLVLLLLLTNFGSQTLTRPQSFVSWFVSLGD